jgi:Zn-finger nucleic acid-binding protein
MGEFYMNCPKCGSALEKIKIKEIELEKCTVCHGLWFDEGELKKITELQLSENEKEELGWSISETKVNVSPKKEGSHLCPKCNNPLREINYLYESPVKIDVCEVCNGIWLDFGELGEIAAYMAKKKDLDEEEKQKYMEIYELAKQSSQATKSKIDSAMTENVGHTKLYKGMVRIMAFLGDLVSKRKDEAE